MKIRKIFSVIFIILIFALNRSVSFMAMSTGFSTEKIDFEEERIFLSNIDLHLINEEPKKNAIVCFDVKDDGLIAVGSENSTEKLVSVYTSNGTFKYGYVFKCSGSFGIEWNDNNIIIYFVRSDVAALFNATGANIKLEKIQDTIDNNYYWNHSVFSTQRTAGENQYTMKNNTGIFNVFSSSYSQIIKTDTEGKVTTVYDVSTTHATKTVIIFIAILFFIVFVVSLIIWQTRKLSINSAK